MQRLCIFWKYEIVSWDYLWKPVALPLILHCYNVAEHQLVYIYVYVAVPGFTKLLACAYPKAMSSFFESTETVIFADKNIK